MIGAIMLLSLAFILVGLILTAAIINWVFPGVFAA